MEIHVYSVAVHKGKILIIMKMFDEQFKLTHVWVYNIFQKYLLGCFFFFKDYELIGYLSHMIQPINNKLNR